MKWQKKTVLITGGTGSFGKRFVSFMLRDYHPAKVIIFSRDELKQHEMRMSTLNESSLRYFIGDVRNRDRLERAMNDVDIVIHAAAMKQVPACEYNPMEAIMTNIMGSRNIIEAALNTGVEKVLAISTDKAVNPVNLYGATKLCAEKLFVQSNAYSGWTGARFSCVRYGNVIGSRGSVIPVFLRQRESGRVTVTDGRMTRFWITLDQGVRFVIGCVERMVGGEIFVPKIPSMNMADLVRAVAPNCKIDRIGIRLGEKMHEVLVSEHEVRQTVESNDMYIIKPIEHQYWAPDRPIEGNLVPDDFRYGSDTNDTRLSVDELKAIIIEFET